MYFPNTDLNLLKIINKLPYKNVQKFSISNQKITKKYELKKENHL